MRFLEVRINTPSKRAVRLSIANRRTRGENSDMERLTVKGERISSEGWGSGVSTKGRVAWKRRKGG